MRAAAPPRTPRRSSRPSSQLRHAVQPQRRHSACTCGASLPRSPTSTAKSIRAAAPSRTKKTSLH
eukprot:3826282-Pyramimonas_sp.AAC.1